MVAVVAPAQTERTAWAVLVAVVGLLWGHPPIRFLAGLFTCHACEDPSIDCFSAP